MSKEEKMSHEKSWAKGCAESLLNNLDFIDVIANVKKNVHELADKYELDEDALMALEKFLEWHKGVKDEDGAD